MEATRSAYGALIRTPLIGPFVRLPVRLARWWVQAPDRDPTTRMDALSSQLETLQGELRQLACAHEVLCRDQERARLILFMMAGQMHPDKGRELGSRQGAARG